MGWCYAPAIGQRFANCVCQWVLRILESPRTDLVPWIDNFVILGDTPSDAIEARATLARCAAHLNLTFKPNAEGPAQRIDAIGLSFDLSQPSTEQHTAALGPKALAHLREARRAFRRRPTHRTFFLAMGGIFWGIFATTRTPLCDYPCLLQCIRDISAHMQRTPEDWDAPLQLPTQALSEFMQLLDVILHNSPIALSDFEAPTEWITLWTDASDTAAAFVIEYAGLDVAWAELPYPVDVRNAHIFIKELWIAAESLHWTRYLLSNQLRVPIVLAEDNTGVVAVIKKGHAREPRANELLRHWFEAARHERVQAAWVPTDVQRADALTRGEPIPGPLTTLPRRWFSDQFTVTRVPHGPSARPTGIEL